MKRIGYIDGLRAVAVLAVVAFHAEIYAHADRTGLLARIVLQGHRGVELFFVLSGFCLSYPTLSVLSEGASTNFDILRFAAKRCVRILPPYYAAIVVFALLGTARVPFTDIVRQALFLDQGTRLLNSSFWSLAVEFRWYFLFPLVLLLWTRSQRTFLFLVVALLALQQTRAVSTDLAALPAFMLGIVAADLTIRRDTRTWLALPLFAIVAVVAFIRTTPTDIGQETSVLWEIAAFLAVVAAGAIPFLTRILSFAPIAFIGVASYGIYLCHELGIAYAERWGYGPWLGALAGLVVGVVFWFIGERPFTDTPLRTALVSGFAQALPRFFSLAGLPSRMRLGGPQAMERTPSYLPVAALELERVGAGDAKDLR